MECIGCKKKFVRAAPLMAHIEKGHCEKISLDKYRMRRVEKKAVKEAMDDQLATSHPFLVKSSVCSSDDGGVGIDDLLDDYDDKTAAIEAKKASIIEKMKTLGLGPARSGNTTVQDTSAETQTAHSIKQWPTFPGRDSDDEDYEDGMPLTRLEQQLEDLMAFSDGTEARGGQGGPTMSTIVPGPIVPSVSGSESGWDTTRIIPARSSTELEIAAENRLSDVEVRKFFSEVHGTYICPCDTSFGTREELEQHIATGVHSAGVTRCPVCLRMFRSSAALVAHCESATKRCKISQTRNFGQVIDEISGGVIGTAGRNDDGTVRFEAAPGAKAIEW
ncbi:hypothetical protein FQN49_004039 [Arthroderma sp. PD_2]|nr:hypothetical protein FQN49_004039 [Arthroderma sp. PD_2]